MSEAELRPEGMMLAEGAQKKQRRAEPIYNFFAQTVGWLKNESTFSNDGRPLAIINNGAIFAVKNDRYLGQFADGVFRDHLGCIVAFIQGAWWCSFLATPQEVRMPPNIPARRAPSHAHFLAAPSRPAEPLLKLSNLNWERFMIGCEAQWLRKNASDDHLQPLIFT